MNSMNVIILLHNEFEIISDFQILICRIITSYFQSSLHFDFVIIFEYILQVQQLDDANI